jgi:hypothetical protein
MPLMLSIALGLLIEAGTGSVEVALIGGSASAVALMTLRRAGRIVAPDLFLREERRAAYVPTRLERSMRVDWAADVSHFQRPRYGWVRGRLTVTGTRIDFMPGGSQPGYPAKELKSWGAYLDRVVLIDVWLETRGYKTPHERLRVATTDGDEELFLLEGGAYKAAASLNALLGRLRVGSEDHPRS